MRFPLNKLLAEHLLTQLRELERSPGSWESPVWSWAVSLGEQLEVCPCCVCRTGIAPWLSSSGAWKFPHSGQNVLSGVTMQLLRPSISVPMS